MVFSRDERKINKRKLNNVIRIYRMSEGKDKNLLLQSQKLSLVKKWSNILDLAGLTIAEENICLKHQLQTSPSLFVGSGISRNSLEKCLSLKNQQSLSVFSRMCIHGIT